MVLPRPLRSAWSRETGLTEEVIREHQGQATRGYITVLVASLIVALALAALVQIAGAKTIVEGLWVGLLVGIGFVATSFAAGYSFEGRSLALYLVNVGYHLVSLSLLGVLLALWR